MSAAAATTLDVARVRKTIGRLREQLAQAVQLLGELYDGRAWVALGLPSWEALCAQELPELGQLLSLAERKDVVVALRRGGASLRAAAAPVGVSAATAKTWTDDAGVQLATVTSLDGRVRPGTANRPDGDRAAGASDRKISRLTNVARAVLVVREAGEQGVTVHALAKRLRLNQCATSALLSRLARDGRLTYRAPAKRGQTGTYVV
jgi:transposase